MTSTFEIDHNLCCTSRCCIETAPQLVKLNECNCAIWIESGSNIINVGTEDDIEAYLRLTRGVCPVDAIKEIG